MSLLSAHLTADRETMRAAVAHVYETASKVHGYIRIGDLQLGPAWHDDPLTFAARLIELGEQLRDKVMDAEAARFEAERNECACGAPKVDTATCGDDECRARYDAELAYEAAF